MKFFDEKQRPITGCTMKNSLYPLNWSVFGTLQGRLPIQHQGHRRSADTLKRKTTRLALAWADLVRKFENDAFMPNPAHGDFSPNPGAVIEASRNSERRSASQYH
jgi:hypothetical protein